MSWKTSETVTFSHDEILQVSCICCECTTSHKVLVLTDVRIHSETGDGYYEAFDTFNQWEKYQVLQCLGCNKKSRDRAIEVINGTQAIDLTQAEKLRDRFNLPSKLFLA